jgi:type IV secretory pathway TrbD component
MANDPLIHVVYTSMNKPLTIWGAERRLFLLALMLGAAAFNFFASLPTGVLLFGTLYAGARWITKTDLQLLRILLNAGRLRAQYDPLTLDPLSLTRTRRHGQA